MKFWIARDEDEMLYLYSKKPTKNEKNGCFDEVIPLIDINKNDFSEVTWKNSPQEVEIKLINNGN